MIRSHFALLTAAFAIGLFLAMLILLEVGRRLGNRRLARQGEESRAGVGVVDGAVYALLAMLLGFNFSGAASRFDARRQLVALEVNAISTAWLHVQLLPAERQPLLRAQFQGYVDALLHSYRSPEDPYHEPEPLQRAQLGLWSTAVDASIAHGGEPARLLLLPAISGMFDVVESERLARLIHPPAPILYMLGLTSLAAALFAGYGLAGGPSRNWMYVLGFAAAISATVFVIVELEYPRLGLIRMDEMDRALTELRLWIR